MLVTVPGARREVDAGSFADLTPVPVLRIRRSATALRILFGGDLKPDERRAVVERCQGSTDSDDLRGAAGDALVRCQAFLDLPAPTGPDAITQVQLLTRMVMALTRLVLRRL